MYSASYVVYQTDQHDKHRLFYLNKAKAFFVGSAMMDQDNPLRRYSDDSTRVKERRHSLRKQRMLTSREHFSDHSDHPHSVANFR